MIEIKKLNKSEKLWKLYYADRKFSDYIRKRDGECQRCHRKDRPLQNSHFWDRQWWATRFDPDNCCALCAWCHTLDRDSWQEDRLGEYKDFMLKKLGKKKYGNLKVKHYKEVKKRNAILKLMSWLSDPVRVDDNEIT